MYNTFRDRIGIIKESYVPDGQGGNVPFKETIASVWAKMTIPKLGKKLYGNAMLFDYDVTFDIRTNVLFLAGYSIAYKARLFRIVYIENDASLKYSTLFSKEIIA